jgi:CBS domain-containing protein
MLVEDSLMPSITVRDIQPSVPIISVRPDDTISEAFARLKQYGMSALAVINPKWKPTQEIHKWTPNQEVHKYIGLVSGMDLLRYILFGIHMAYHTAETISSDIKFKLNCTIESVIKELPQQTHQMAYFQLNDRFSTVLECFGKGIHRAIIMEVNGMLSQSDVIEFFWTRHLLTVEQKIMTMQQVISRPGRKAIVSIHDTTLAITGFKKLCVHGGNHKYTYIQIDITNQ